MDDGYLDEAVSYDKSGPTPPKQGRSLSPRPNGSIAQPSNSFNYKSYSPKITTQNSSSINENMPTHVVDGDNVLPLTHTISFYRRQQPQTTVTPVRQVIRQPSLEEQPEAEALEEGVDKKIQALLDEVSKQQTVISQTSQALNLCYSTLEFTGSTEQVEAEKVLLLATHRRQAALHEIQRLKVEGTLRPKSTRTAGFHVEKGTLTISNVVLPLKREYARALAAAGGKGHHVICLVKCDEQVVSTQLVSTVAGSLKNLELELNIPGTIVLENVRGDFTVTFEVYCLQAQEEILPHEVKYHIHKKQGKVTPKKPKAENRMIKPPKESPAGPQAVRSPTFALIGYVVLSIQATKKKQWTLNKTPSMSPLEGTVQMTINYKPQITVKHKGFLTMFEDVSGFGAWHRRWCMLEKGVLVYWKYPDDEKKKEPINSIDLNYCATEKVGPVSREICARLNTFLIEIERDAQPQDKESLVTIRKGKKTIIRHLLSADTKEERIEWCDAFNKALAALRLSK
ncbi:anillin-like [Agrilus planipennis]|uniref:Anillin-like n=1 Tax=Agrilus planipennis TaxID=224129 RepID=A0A1W4XPJ7_AGRPL|nr:anillin-like [Agrilus planipennis]XP_018334409.1 anillin-like [Agrilus planipennis]